MSTGRKSDSFIGTLSQNPALVLKLFEQNPYIDKEENYVEK